MNITTSDMTAPAKEHRQMFMQRIYELTRELHELERRTEEIKVALHRAEGAILGLNEMETQKVETQKVETQKVETPK